jgi:hypothetical protein
MSSGRVLIRSPGPYCGGGSNRRLRRRLDDCGSIHEEKENPPVVVQGNFVSDK